MVEFDKFFIYAHQESFLKVLGALHVYHSSFKEQVMNIDRIVLLVAGSMILVSAILSVYHASEWIYLTGFVGANLMFSAITGFCPMVKILEKLGVKHGSAFK